MKIELKKGIWENPERLREVYHKTLMFNVIISSIMILGQIIMQTGITALMIFTLMIWITNGLQWVSYGTTRNKEE